MGSGTDEVDGVKSNDRLTTAVKRAILVKFCLRPIIAICREVEKAGIYAKKKPATMTLQFYTIGNTKITHFFLKFQAQLLKNILKHLNIKVIPLLLSGYTDAKEKFVNLFWI